MYIKCRTSCRRREEILKGKEMQLWQHLKLIWLYQCQYDYQQMYCDQLRLYKVIGYCRILTSSSSDRSSSSKISRSSIICFRVSGGSNTRKSLRTTYWIINSSNNNNNNNKVYFLSMVPQPLSKQDLLIIKASRAHSDTQISVVFFLKSDQSVPKTSTC